MNARRKFLIYSSLTAFAATLGAGSYFRNAGINFSSLGCNLEFLYDERFRLLALTSDPDTTFESLTKRDVFTADGEVNIDRVRQLAKSDRKIIHEGQYFTETEIDLHCLAYHLHEMCE